MSSSYYCCTNWVENIYMEMRIYIYGNENNKYGNENIYMEMKKRRNQLQLGQDQMRFGN